MALTPKQAPKPQPVAKPLAAQRHTRVAVERSNANEYRVVELTYDSPPVSRRVLQESVSRVPAEDEVRLWQETHLGLDRFGDSGL